MSPRSAKQLDDIRKQKKELIMETALELFANNGFHATTISQIARKAGISKGLAYNYFESKNELLQELIDQGFQEVGDMMVPEKDGFPTDGEFASFVGNSFDMVGNDLRHWRLFYSLLLQPTVAENFNEKYAKISEPFFKMMYAYIAGKGNTDPEGDVMIISSMIEGALLYLIVASEIFPKEQLKQKVIEGIFRIIESGHQK